MVIHTHTHTHRVSRSEPGRLIDDDVDTWIEMEIRDRVTFNLSSWLLELPHKSMDVELRASWNSMLTERLSLDVDSRICRTVMRRKQMRYSGANLLGNCRNPYGSARNPERPKAPL